MTKGKRVKRIFDKFATEEDGNAVIDWTVLMAGMVLMAISVVIAITANVDQVTDNTMDRVESMEDWLPS